MSEPIAEDAKGGAGEATGTAKGASQSTAYPPGWYRVLDVSLQKHYYFHTGTKKTYWTRPDGLTEEPPIYGKPHRPKGNAAESKELGGGPAAAGTAAAKDSFGASTDPSADDSPPGSPAKGGKNKLRSLVKGVANLLGLRRRGQERADSEAAGDDEREGSYPPSLPAATGGPSSAPAPGAAAATGSAPGPSGAPAGDAPGASAGGTGASSGAGEGGAAGPASASGAEGGDAAAADGEDGAPATPPYGRPKLTRRPSILKRGGSGAKEGAGAEAERPRGMGKRRISFADQKPEGELEQTYFADNLHYSPSADHSMAFDSRSGDDNKCVVS